MVVVLGRREGVYFAQGRMVCCYTFNFRKNKSMLLLKHDQQLLYIVRSGKLSFIDKPSVWWKSTLVTSYMDTNVHK